LAHGSLLYAARDRAINGESRFDLAFQLSGDANANAVPEPATLMLVGTGLAAAWRQRRRRAQ